MTAPSTSLKAAPLISHWVGFESGRVQIRSGKVEIGQGIGHALMRIAAEELEVPMEIIDLVQGRTAETPNELWSSASISVEVGGLAVRQACTHARALALAEGARLQNVHPEDAGVADCGRGTADMAALYDAVAPSLDLDVPVDPALSPKPRSDYSVLPEKTVPHDLRDRLTGKPGAFLQDFTLPGMLHARVLHPPCTAGVLLQCDETALAALPCVRHVVRDGSFVALVAETEHDAIRAAQAASAHVSWDTPDLPEGADLPALLKDLPAERRRILTRGDAVTSVDVELCVTRPFLAHASVGLSTAVARPDDKGMTVWTQSQGVYPTRDEIARTLGIASEDLRLIHVPGAGCYGHNGADDVALDAALCARAVGAPVRVSWTRTQEMTSAPLGSGMMVDVGASLAQGRITGWTHKVRSLTHLTRPGWGDGINLLSAWRLGDPHAASDIDDPGQVPFGGGGDRNAIPLYAVPNIQVTYDMIKAQPVRTSALRSLGAHANVFAIESLMDECALSVGADPVAFRLAHLEDPRARAVLRCAADMASWDDRSSGGDGIGWGIGLGRYKNKAAYFAVALRLEADAALHVTNVHCAVDCGLPVDPDGVRNQIEGGIVQALSWTLKEETVLRPDGLSARGWDTYSIINWDELPSKLEVKIMDAENNPALGVGECTMGPVAGAVGNAIRNALGVRLTAMPLTPQKLLEALA